MAGENTAYPLVTTKGSAVIAEGLKLSLATPGGSMTPSTVTAMVGIVKGEALKLAPEVTAVMGELSKHIAMTPNSAGYIPGVSGPSGSAKTALTNLTTLQGKIMPSGNHAAFGAFLSQAQGHINDSIEIQNATSFISNANFADFGSGIGAISSMADQGLTGTLGNLPSAGNAMAACGKLFNTKDMGTFGTPAGLINQLNSNKLGNSTGLNEALAKAGVDLNNLSDPVYADSIEQVLTNTNDPDILEKVKTQLGVNPAGEVSNLKDLLDVKKLVSESQLDGLNGGLSDIGRKFSDMGASFASPDAAKNMLNNISLPNVPKLDFAGSSMKSLMDDNKSTIEGMIGKSQTDSPNGIPNITDFMGVVGGGGIMKQLSQSTDITAIVAGVNTSVSRANSLMTKAGIDLNTPPSGMSAAKNFAEGLHKFGSDTSGSGVDKLIANMANGDSKFGEAITASLAEGKNKALMLASGIPPLNFEGAPAGEAVKNLQQGKFIPGTGSMTPEQINKIFGSGT